MAVDGIGGAREEFLRQERQSEAVVSFLGAGLLSPPSRSVMVSVLADARRAVRAHRARSAPIDSWLVGEIRLKGVRENAAVLAVLELPEHRADVAAAYRREHPDRAAALDMVMAILVGS